MDFEFDDDQLGLQAAAADVLAKECPPSYVRAVVEKGDSAAGLWDTLCSLDWPGLAITAEHGGVGASALELAIVLEQLGYVADPTPFLATTTQFVPLIATCGDESQRQRFLGAVAAEGRAGTLALAPEATATRVDGGWALSGQASLVVDGDRAEEIAVVVGTGDRAEVFVVPGAVVAARRSPAFDAALHVADVEFDGVTVEDDRHLGNGDVELALDHAVMGLAMVTVGACQRALDMVVEYVSERQQFGVPVGSFQAVKHKAVDMYVAVERARALAYFAALTIAERDPRRPLATAMAKAAAGDAQLLVFQDAIQLFGGIGFTWENDLHLYLRRAKAAALLFGGAAEHRARVGRLLLEGSGSPTERLTGAPDVR